MSAVRRRPTITASRRCSRRDGIIPLGVEFIGFDVEGGHLGIGDLDPLWIGPSIEFAVHARTSGCRRCGDQIDHDQTTGQGRAAPVLADMAEQSVLDPRIKSGDKPCSISRYQAGSGKPEA